MRAHNTGRSGRRRGSRRRPVRLIPGHPAGVLGDHLTEDAVQPATVAAVQVLVHPPAAAVGAGALVGRIPVGLQRPAHGPHDMVADPERRLPVRGAQAEHGDGTGLGRRVVTGDPIDEVGENGRGVERGGHRTKLCHQPESAMGYPGGALRRLDVIRHCRREVQVGVPRIEAASRALTRPTHRAVAALAAVAMLLAVAVAAGDSVRPPEALGAGAPAAEFSAGRAFQQVQAIATEPHAAGSGPADAVRERLLATLRGLGLDPQVQDTVSVQGGELSASAGGIGLARVRNVVTLLPGTASTGRIFLVAHYDSVQTGPGANDDGAGTAAVLETARALTGRPRLRNDVVFVLTDAEEACVCGAQAFVDQHPLARDGGIVLNLEARGSTGPAIMFETAADNERLAGVFAGAPKPVGTSVAVEVYRRLPNDTDFTPFL